MLPVDNPADPRVADYRYLNDPDGRRRRELPRGPEGGFFVAEGPIVIRRLLTSRFRLRSLLLTERGARALEPELREVQAPSYLVTQDVMDAVCGFNFHRGALAAADRRPLPPVADVVAGTGLVVVAEGVNDSENLGAIFRNAAAFGAGAVLLDATCADPLYRRSIRVSAGHVLHLPFTRATEWPGAIGMLRSSGFEVLALTPDPDAEDLREIRPRPRQALMLGAEASGLSPAALAAADRRVRIAMAPGVDSLNVATAAAVVLHHLAATPPDGGNRS